MSLNNDSKSGKIQSVASYTWAEYEAACHTVHEQEQAIQTRKAYYRHSVKLQLVERRFDEVRAHKINGTLTRKVSL